MKKFPQWHQTSIASCGAAALLMVFNYYEPSIVLTREKEWEIWRDASMLVWTGCHPYGMAVAALKRGFSVNLVREKKALWRDECCPENNEPMRFFMGLQEREAKRLGAKETFVGDIDLEFLEELLDNGKFPIVLIKSIKKNGRLDGIHWIVLIGINKGTVFVNDPDENGRSKMPIRQFLKGWNAVRDKKLNTAKEVVIVEK